MPPFQQQQQQQQQQLLYYKLVNSTLRIFMDNCQLFYLETFACNWGDMLDGFFTDHYLFLDRFKAIELLNGNRFRQIELNTNTAK